MFFTNCTSFNNLLFLLSQSSMIQCTHLPVISLLSEEITRFNNSDSTFSQLGGRDLTSDEKALLLDLSNQFKGIYWYQAYPGGFTDDGGCTV